MTSFHTRKREDFATAFIDGALKSIRLRPFHIIEEQIPRLRQRMAGKS